ncbi:DUF1540 domain-containing protein [Clostridium tarantellae]|uniref:DUF1540 domain-containing protein n=1 Tax=Clostridium tarantellae TaxID=39493 RepID=A0A6I1MJ06_9CLOT|nr:DUF1540 domain-containing protein [Clostridium tarantellae]MPQ42683.1 DUF1540 domain-containing protein [Clostridium tarantellae]
MARLICTAYNCVNNVNSLCTAFNLHIEGEKANCKSETMCETFAPRTFINALKNTFNTNYVGSIMQALNPDFDVVHHIYCNVTNCTYNIGLKCTSTDIRILGDNANTSENTECETFFHK